MLIILILSAQLTIQISQLYQKLKKPAYKILKYGYSNLKIAGLIKCGKVTLIFYLKLWIKLIILNLKIGSTISEHSLKNFYYYHHQNSQNITNNILNSNQTQ